MPVLGAFNLHLGNGGLSNVPVQFTFRTIGGSELPVCVHIQVYMNGALFWDIQLHRQALIIEDVSVLAMVCACVARRTANFD